jgi:hypothetical protein
MALWPHAAIAWINTYNEFVRNAAKMNEYWLNLLYRPWTREQKNASSEKIRQNNVEKLLLRTYR